MISLKFLPGFSRQSPVFSQGPCKESNIVLQEFAMLTELLCDLAPTSLTKFNWGHTVLPSSYAGFQSVSKIPQALFCPLPFPLPEIFLPSSLHVQIGLILETSAQIQLF